MTAPVAMDPRRAAARSEGLARGLQGDIGALPARQDQPQRVAQGIDAGVDLGRRRRIRCLRAADRLIATAFAVSRSARADAEARPARVLVGHPTNHGRIDKDWCGYWQGNRRSSRSVRRCTAQRLGHQTIPYAVCSQGAFAKRPASGVAASRRASRTSAAPGHRRCDGACAGCVGRTRQVGKFPCATDPAASPPIRPDSGHSV